MKTQQILSRLSSQLKQELPGKPAQQKMMVKTRHTFSTVPRDSATPAAVLILLFPRNSEIRFYLTERTHAVESHKGQISLPGGAKEKDEKLTATAIRETHEEIGVTPDDIIILGELTSLFVPLTGFIIHPFVGWIAQEPLTAPDPAEVRTLFSASLPDLLSDDSILIEPWEIHGHTVTVPFFQLGQFKVWGATAMILSEFKEIIRGII